MKKPTRKQTILIIAGIIIIITLIYAFMPGDVPVQTATVKFAPLQVTVEEEGKTHVKEHYTISSPVAGFMQRIELEEGDMVEEGDLLVQIEPPRSTMLDPRSRAEAEARVEAVEASLKKAKAQAEQAKSNLERIEQLAKQGSATPQQLDQAQTKATQALAALDAAQAELTAARAAVGAATDIPASIGVTQTLRAPASGYILAIHHKSEGHINAGEPLIELGNTNKLKIRVEVLSEDAVRIAPGMRVILTQWGGETPLKASVTRIERQGKEEVSALGVEQQRVQVIAEIDSPPKMWSQLGSGYRVLAQFIIWEDNHVLQVPTSALFRTKEGWAVFVVQSGTAIRKKVKVGHQAGLSAQILEDLSEGDKVIVHPGSDLKDGTEVEIK